MKVTHQIPGEVPGAAFGAMSREQYKDFVKEQSGGSIQQRLSQTKKKLDKSYSSSEHVQNSPKIAGDRSGKAYLAGGAISIDTNDGRMVLANGKTENSRPVIEASNENGFKSSAKTTFLGSLDIKTFAGDLLNPLTSGIPSSHFSPVTVWTKNLFPTNNIIVISILEGIAALLLMELSDSRSKSASKTNLHRNFDMGLTIQDNAELEAKVLNRALRR